MKPVPALAAPAAPDAPVPSPRTHRLPECPECHGHNTPVVHGTRILPTAIVQYRECRDCRWRFKTTKPYGGTSEDETLLG